MPVIGQEAFVLAPTTDKFVSLANEEFARQIDFGPYGDSGWSSVRIGLHVAFADNGAGTFTNSELFIGMCHGTTYPYASQNCLNAAGLRFNINAGTWTRNAGGGNPYYTTNGARAVHKVGVTETEVVGSATFTYPIIGGSIERRGFLALTLVPTSTNFVARGYSGSSTAAQVDTWLEHFLYGCNQAGTPYVQESACVVTGPTVTPGAGWNSTYPVNSVNIWWANSTYLMRIYAMYVLYTI